jgi:hypothetical protein
MRSDEEREGGRMGGVERALVGGRWSGRDSESKGESRQCSNIEPS